MSCSFFLSILFRYLKELTKSLLQLSDVLFLITSMLARRRRNNSGSDRLQQQVLHSSLEQQWQSNSTISNPPTEVSLSRQDCLSPQRQEHLLIHPDMTCRDRSNEFLSVVKSLQSRQVSRGS